MSRFRTFVLFATLAVLASALVACGGGGSDDPQSVVDEATLQGIESADLDLSLAIDVQGKRGGHVDVSLGGPFQSESGADLPELDLTATAKGSIGDEDVDFDGGLVLLGNKAFVSYEGTEYEVDPTTFNFVTSAIRQQGGGGKSDEAPACQDAVAELEPAEFIDGLEDGGSADVGGTETTKVSGDLDAPRAIEALIELLEDPACSEQLQGTDSLPSTEELEEAKSTVQDSVESAHIDLYVGEDDIVRRVVAQVKVAPRGGSGDGKVKAVDVDLDLTLTGVNEEQTISAPSSARPLSQLFLKLGINPIELLGILQNGAGAADLGDLLEGLNSAGGDSSGEGSGGGSSGGGREAYLECLQDASSPVDIQNCTGLL